MDQLHHASQQYSSSESYLESFILPLTNKIIRNALITTKSTKLNEQIHLFLITYFLKCAFAKRSRGTQRMKQLAVVGQLEQLTGYQTFKQYRMTFQQFLTDHKSLISAYLNPLQQPMRTDFISFQPTFQQQLPTFTSNIRKILNHFSQIRNSDFQKMLDQISETIKIELVNQQNNLSDRDQAQYTQIGLLNQKIGKQYKKFKRFKSFECTKQKMVLLDDLSIFLKIGYQYKRAYKMSSFVYSNQYLCRVFDCSETEMDGLIERFSQFYHVIVPHNNFYLNQLAQILYLVELRKKIANFYRRYGKNRFETFVYKKEEIASIQEELSMNQQAYFSFHKDFQYKFCQVAFIPGGKQSNRPLYQILQSRQAQLRQALKRILKESNSLSDLRLKQQILLLKVRFSTSFMSIYCYYLQMIQENQQEKMKKQKDGAHFSLDLQVCPWIFIRNQGLHTAIKQVFNLQVDYTLVQKDSALFISLCEMAIKRFSLLATVIKSHQKIDYQQKRQIVYICKFLLKSSDFSTQINGNGCDNAFTLVLAVVDSDIRYVVLSPGKMDDIQYARIIKAHFQSIKKTKMSIVLYTFCYDDQFNSSAFKPLFAVRSYGDIRVYFSNSPASYHLHFMAFYLIKMLISYHLKDPSQFAEVVKSATSKILKAINVDKDARDILRACGSGYETINCRAYNPQFDEKIMRQTILKAYQSLTMIIFQRNDSESFWDKVDLRKEKCFREFVIGQFIHKLEWYSDRSRVKQLLEWMKDKQIDFVSDFVEEMRWRHPYVSPKEFANIRFNLNSFRKVKHMRVKDIRRILMYVCRYLLCYQAYYNQIVYKNQLDQSGNDQLRSYLTFLQEIYAQQSRWIERLYPHEKEKIAQQLFTIDLKTGQKLGKKDYSVWNRKIWTNGLKSKKKSEF